MRLGGECTDVSCSAVKGDLDRNRRTIGNEERQGSRSPGSLRGGSVTALEPGLDMLGGDSSKGKESQPSTITNRKEGGPDLSSAGSTRKKRALKALGRTDSYYMSPEIQGGLGS